MSDSNSSSSPSSPSVVVSNFTLFPDEIISHILLFLDSSEILHNISHCNKQLLEIAASKKWWLDYASVQLPCHSSTLASLTTKQIQQCCIVSTKRKNSSSELWLERDNGENDKFWWPRSLLPTKREAFDVWRLRGRYCLASTTDRDAEIAENVLLSDDRDRYIHNRWGGESAEWWSSAPCDQSSPEDTNEVILFTTKVKAIITEVAIKALREPSFGFNGGTSTVFSWPRISIKVYSLPQEGRGPILIKNETFLDEVDQGLNHRSRDNRLNQRPIIDAMLRDHTPTYESPVMDSKSTDDSWQYHEIPDGVMGNVITFTLYGKTFEQFQQSGYYVCVDQVVARGVEVVE